MHRFVNAFLNTGRTVFRKHIRFNVLKRVELFFSDSFFFQEGKIVRPRGIVDDSFLRALLRASSLSALVGTTQ